MAGPRKRQQAPEPKGPAFGAHMSIAGGCEKAVEAAHSFGFRSVQLFTKNNNQWNAPPIRPEQAEAFREALRRTGIAPAVAHTSYLINLASPDDVLWERSIEAMVVEVRRCAELGIPDLVMHPGAHMGSGEEAGFRRVASALDRIHRRTEGAGVTVDLETTAGQGTSLGHRFAHLRAILDLVEDPGRLGVCADTCHLFAAGYPLERRDGYDEMVEELAETVGIDRLRVWHLNDSCRDRGSRVDRHAGIGAGKMGLEPFRFLVNDDRFSGRPLILETPKGLEDGEELDARNLRILRSLVRTGPSRASRPSA